MCINLCAILLPGKRTPEPMMLAAINTVNDYVMGRLGDMENNGGRREDSTAADAVVHLRDGSFEDTVLQSSSLWFVEFCSPR